jgi:hypothetical protein|tara:strand:+ start:219 stop:767 length:549 start_codon:yes stop_codon:yes gene_type:complete
MGKRVGKYKIGKKESALSLLDGGIIDGALSVAGSVTFNSTATVTGATTLSSTADVTGATTLAGGSTLSASNAWMVQEVTALGANQTNSAAISASSGTFVNVTGADNTTCVQLPLLSTVDFGTTYFVFNNAASNTLEIFPGVDDKVNPAADNAAITTAADTITMFTALDATQWIGAEFPVVAA